MTIWDYGLNRIVFLELMVVTIGFCKFRMVLRSTCIIVSSKASHLTIRAMDDVGQRKLLFPFSQLWIYIMIYVIWFFYHFYHSRKYSLLLFAAISFANIFYIYAIFNYFSNRVLIFLFITLYTRCDRFVKYAK